MEGQRAKNSQETPEDLPNRDAPNIKTYQVIGRNPMCWYWFMDGPVRQKRELRNRPVHICELNFCNFKI